MLSLSDPNGIFKYLNETTTANSVKTNKQTKNKPPLGGMAQSVKFSVLKHEDATLRHPAPM